MIPHTLRIRYSSKLGLPNYSSVEAEVEITYELEDSDDLAEATKLGFASVKQHVLDNIRVAKAHVADQQQALGEGAYDKPGANASSYRR